jgi:HEAT repeat protein
MVSLHAFRVLAERATLSAAQRSHAIAALETPDPHLQRAAAEALARFPKPASLNPLLTLASTMPETDTHLA